MRRSYRQYDWLITCVFGNCLNNFFGSSATFSHGQVQRVFPFISPPILTGQSQLTSESFHMQEPSKATNKTQLTQPCVSLTGGF